MIDVVGEPDRNASLRRGRERARDESSRGLLELEVVERQLEGLFRARDELARVLGDLERALPAVGEGADLERQAYPRARKYESATLATAMPRSPAAMAGSKRP